MSFAFPNSAGHNSNTEVKSERDIIIEQLQARTHRMQAEIDELREKYAPANPYDVLVANERELEKLREEIKRLNDVVGEWSAHSKNWESIAMSWKEQSRLWQSLSSDGSSSRTHDKSGQDKEIEDLRAEIDMRKQQYKYMEDTANSWRCKATLG